MFAASADTRMKGDITRVVVSGMMRSLFLDICDKCCLFKKVRLGQGNIPIKENWPCLTASNYIYLHL